MEKLKTIKKSHDLYRQALPIILIFFSIIILIFNKTGGDIFWHIRVGEWIIQQWNIPKTAIFSHSIPDKTWLAHEWLSEVILYIIYKYASWIGLSILATSCSLISIGMAIIYCKKYLPDLIVFYITLSFFALLSAHILPRPHIIALPLLTYWTISLLEAINKKTTPKYFTIFILIAWTNLHGSFLIALAFIIFFSIEAIYTEKDPLIQSVLIKKWGKYFLVAIFSTLINPYSFHALLLPLQLTSQDFATSHILEWTPPNFQNFQPFELWLLTFIALTLRFQIKIPFFRLVFFLGLIHLSLKHSRYISDLLALLAPISLAYPVSQNKELFKNLIHSSQYKLISNYRNLVLTISLFSFILITTSPFFFKINYFDKTFQDSDPIIQHVKNLNLGNVFNSYELGGYLIFNGIDTFIDPRAEAYGDQFLKTYHNAINLNYGQASLEQILKQNSITWTIFSNYYPAFTYFDMNPDWIQVYKNNQLTIFIHKSILEKWRPVK